MTALDELTYDFASLDIQSANFGDMASHFKLSDDPDTRMPQTFHSLDDAERYLLIIHSNFNGLATEQLNCGGRMDKGIASWMTIQQGSLLSSLRSWQLSFANSALRPFRRALDPLTTRLQCQYTSCQLRSTCLTVYVQTVLNGGDEMGFDALLPQFSKIVGLCEELAPATPKISIDIGIIQPLFVVGCFCRHPNIRRRCIRALSEAGVEGYWDSRLVKLLTRYRMETEEAEAGYIHDDTVPFPEDEQLLSKTIPATARYSQSFAAFLDSDCRQVEIQLRRRKFGTDVRAQPANALEIKKAIVGWPPIH